MDALHVKRWLAMHPWLTVGVPAYVCAVAAGWIVLTLRWLNGILALALLGVALAALCLPTAVVTFWRSMAGRGLLAVDRAMLLGLAAGYASLVCTSMPLLSFTERRDVGFTLLALAPAMTVPAVAAAASARWSRRLVRWRMGRGRTEMAGLLLTGRPPDNDVK